MSGNKHLFEIKKKNGYLGNIDSDKSPNNVPIRRQRQGVFMRKRRGTITIEGRHFYRCRTTNTVMFIPKNVFYFSVR